MSPTSPRTTAALLIVGALVAGIVLGVAGDHVYLLRAHRLLPSSRVQGFMAKRLVERLDDELHLTAQQKTAVTQIVERHRARINAIVASTRPQIRQEVDATNGEIEKVLNPDQIAKFREISTRMRQRHHRGMGSATPAH